jgi:peptidoglycan/xylan/chitin deacetylase (PgdA/CDA1 family)
MNLERLWLRSTTACQRRAARWFGRRLFAMRATRPIVSFTFDDFPRSALHIGGAILEHAGAKGTYYASLGLAGQATPTGEIFNIEDLHALLIRGHELGCHTFQHCPAWQTKPRAFEAAIQRNAEALRHHAPAARFRSLSYPISQPRPANKRSAGRYFACSRGGGQSFNTGTIDLNCLNAFFIEQSRDNPEQIKRMIELNAKAGGWLIFATHDVDEHPTRYGCTPSLFEDIVHWSVSSGASVLPVFSAMELMGAAETRHLNGGTTAVGF